MRSVAWAISRRMPNAVAALARVLASGYISADRQGNHHDCRNGQGLAGATACGG